MKCPALKYNKIWYSIIFCSSEKEEKEEEGCFDLICSPKSVSDWELLRYIWREFYWKATPNACGVNLVAFEINHDVDNFPF